MRSTAAVRARARRFLSCGGLAMRWLRRATAAAALLVAGVSLGAEPKTPAARADEVLVALGGADSEGLRRLAASESPDPWLVADELCCRGEVQAAATYARAAPASPDVQELAAFVEGRAGAPAPASVAHALRTAATATDAAAVVAAIEAAGDVTSPFDRARLAWGRALALRRLDVPEEAAKAFVATADAAERAGWLRRTREALSGAAFQAARLLDYGRARDLWTRQLAVERRRGRADSAADCLQNLAGVDAELGNYAAACARFEEVAAEFAKRGEPGRRGTIRVLGNLAVTRWRAGEYAKSLDAGRRALDLVAASGEDDVRAGILVTQGDTLRDLGDLAAAEASHRAAIAAAGASGSAAAVALANASLGLDLLERGDFDAARAVCESALAPLTKPDDEPLVARLLTNLTLAHVGRRDFASARDSGVRAVALAAKVGDDQTRANALQNLAQACRGAGDLAAAAEAAGAAVEIARRLDSAQVASLSWAEAAENAAAAGDPAAAAAAWRLAIEAVGRMTSGLAEGQGAQARERYGRYFRLACAAAIELGDAAALFEFAENGRAVDFLASLEQGESIRQAVVPPALREAEDAARAAEAAASLRHQAAMAGGHLAEIRARKAELDAARARHEDAVGRIRTTVRSAASIFPKPVADAEARAALAADDALVVYTLSDTSCAALVLTRAEIRLVPLGAAKDVAAACAAWDPAAPAEKADGAVSALRKTIVEPLRLADATRRVLVSPDGDVYRAPLAALFAGREVVHVPSASTYARLAADARIRGTKVLAAGAVDYAGRGVAALPESGPEAKAAASRPGDVLLTGAAASEAGVRAAIAKEPRWLAVHFATHGVVDAKRPMRCGLVLAAAPSDDGVLTALEVLQQPVPADLVVLSACDSGGGRVFAGEGLVGMPRAFLFAGAPRVVASSWKVDDAATRALMTKFYELWRGRGLRASAALAGAVDAVRADARWTHPRFWAAWSVWGTGD